MYDPTIFENLKVAFENHVYDLDNLERKIVISNRLDQMDFATMARTFAIHFSLSETPDVTVEIELKAALEDLAGEILEMPGNSFGCFLTMRFTKAVQEVHVECKKIEEVLNTIWENDIELSQTLSFFYGQNKEAYLDTIEAKFISKIGEEHMSDIADFLDHVLTTLAMLNDI